MIEGTAWQEKLETITTSPRANFIVSSKNLLYLSGGLWLAKHIHMSCLIGFLHLLGEVILPSYIKVDIVVLSQLTKKIKSSKNKIKPLISSRTNA